jgi:hypothetical protein
MYNLNELKTLGFIPRSGYKLDRAFPVDFKLPQFISTVGFKKIPLYIQVRYETEVVNAFHELRRSNQ